MAPSTGDASPLSRTSLREQAYEVMRRWIITETLPHGAKIVERELAAQLGVSRAPINDALIRLRTEGFVEKKPDGWYVVSFDREQIEQVYAVRIRLEPLAAELAARNASEELLRALRQAMAEYEEALAHGEHGSCVEADVAIHSLIWKHAQNQYLRNALRVVAVPTFMLIPNCIRFAEDWSGTLQEHRTVIAAITDGDVKAAGRAMKEHLRKGVVRSLRACGVTQRG